VYKFAIVGLGRIGKSLFWIIDENKDFEVSLIIDINNSIKNILYILNYDSTYQRNKERFILKNGKIYDSLNHRYIEYLSTDSIKNTKHKSHNINFLIISSGIKLKNSELNFLKKQKYKTFITNSDVENIPHYVFGVNDRNISKKEKIVSTSICDSVAISPIIKIFKKFDIISGSITTVHPLLNYQSALDSKSASWSVPGEIHGHFELGRGFLNNIIPKPTSALKAVEKVLNLSLSKKISTFSYRIPTTIIGSADITLLVKKDISLKIIKEEVDKLNKNEKVIMLNSNPLTSLDFIGNEYNCVLDLRWLRIIRKDGIYLIKIILWYDNEYGYSQNLIKIIKRNILDI
jgi:glyceraldehyde 3-phosphate dehydrogenase